MARRVFANFRLLLGGRGMAALLNVGALAALARSLELAEVGTVVLVHTYVLAVRGLMNVKPFLAIVRWGLPLLEGGDRQSLRALLELSRRIDRLTALSSAALGAALAPLAGVLMEWESNVVGYCALYSAALLLSGVGTATGYLQLINRFDLLAQQMLVGPAIRFAGALTASLTAPRMETFLVIWGTSIAVEYLFLAWQGRRKCAESGLVLSWTGSGSFASFPGMPRFLAATYAQAILEMVPNRVATLMVGASLGPESAALLRAAQNCSTVLTKPATLLSQAVFPDLTRLWNDNHRKFRRLIVKVGLVAGSVGLCLTLLSLVFGGWLLGTLFGPEFTAAQVLLAWLVLAATFDLGGAPLTPAGYAMDRAGRILAGRTLSTIIFILGYFLLQAQFGIDGVGMAAVTSSVCFWLALVLIVSRAPPAPAVTGPRSGQ